MKRRDFLVTILGSAAALAVIPDLDLLAAAEHRAVDEALLWRPAYASVLREAHRLFANKMLAGGLPIDPAHVYIAPAAATNVRHGWLFGHTLPDGTIVSDQFNVGTNASDLDRSSQEQWLDPAMEALADRALWDGIDRYARLALPSVASGVEYAGTYGALRMIVARVSRPVPSQQIRFDVLGGASPVGRAFVAVRKREFERTRQASLKMRIRGRLGRGDYRKESL